MRLRTLVLALAMSGGLAWAATPRAAKHAKPPKASRHTQMAKAVKRKSAAFKPIVHKGRKAAGHAYKAVKYKAVKAKKRKR
jgi:hypothetical protein